MAERYAFSSISHKPTNARTLSVPISIGNAIRNGYFTDCRGSATIPQVMASPAPVISIRMGCLSPNTLPRYDRNNCNYDLGHTAYDFLCYN